MATKWDAETVRNTSEDGRGYGQFTADEAFEFEGTADAIMMTSGAVRKLFAEHGAEFSEFLEDIGHKPGDAFEFDAGKVLGWLGY